jgi:hypothetical protein
MQRARLSVHACIRQPPDARLAIPRRNLVSSSTRAAIFAATIANVSEWASHGKWTPRSPTTAAARAANQDDGKCVSSHSHTGSGSGASSELKIP